MPEIRTAFSLQLLPLYSWDDARVVVIDILRASTSICAALAHGATCVRPLASRDQAQLLHDNGSFVASEKEGKRLPFADIGNSPTEFTPDAVGGREVVYCTTNGTKAITAVASAKQILVGAFANLSALASYLTAHADSPLLLLCSGWKGFFNLEDTIFAGALAQRLLESGYSAGCDATKAAIDLWNTAKDDLLAYAKTVDHWKRLQDLGLGASIPICFRVDAYPVIPAYHEGVISNIH